MKRSSRLNRTRRVPVSRHDSSSIPGRRGFLQGTAALGISITLPQGALAQDGGEVNFYNWDTYIGEDTIAMFEDKTGIEVQYDLYADNDELFAKLRGGNPGYDIIVPTNDYVERMVSADMLMPVDHDLLPNLKNIAPEFMNREFDKGRKFSIPYLWGTIGIGYRKSVFDTPPDSWKLLLDSDEYAGRIALMSESQTVLQMAMKYRGHSLNDWTKENVAEAEALIKKQKKNIASFAPDNGQDLLLAGEVDLVMEWNGDILQVMEEDDDIGYALPKEGGLLWEDCLCIPKGAPNVENAHKLINHILDGEVGAGIADWVYYATPNEAAREQLSEDYNMNPAVFPSEEALEKSEISVFSGQETLRLIDDAWTRIKSA